MTIINIRELNSPYTITLMRLLMQGSLGDIMVRNNMRQFINGDVQVYKVKLTPTDVNFCNQYNELARALGIPEVRLGVENTIHVININPLTRSVPIFIEYVKRKLPIIYPDPLTRTAEVSSVITHSVRFTHCTFDNGEFTCQYEVY